MKTKNSFLLLIALIVSTVAAGQQTIDRLEIQKSDSVVLSVNTRINELIIHADKNSAGQLLITSGIVQVDRLVYNFTFVPAEWTIIAFPTAIADLRSPSVSNLTELGFNFSNGAKRFQLRRYDPSVRATDKDPWVNASDAFVAANTGVMMNVVTGTSTPQSIEFYFNNTTLGSSSSTGDVLVDLDLKGKQMQHDYRVTIEPLNAAGKALEITVRNAPEASAAPLNYADELTDAAIYFTDDRKAVRIALPTSETCKVLVLDRRMKKVLDAYSYSSPAAIPVGHLKKGTYRLYIEYGPASEVKTLKIK